ncbi:hypothetical protein ACTHGU_10000 [Chitinophagaceae bacterium MMS25-I14]
MTRQKLLETATQMPENFELEEFIEKLIVVEKIDNAIESVTAGRIVTNDEARRHIEEIKKKAR